MYRARSDTDASSCTCTRMSCNSSANVCANIGATCLTGTWDTYFLQHFGKNSEARLNEHARAGISFLLYRVPVLPFAELFSKGHPQLGHETLVDKLGRTPRGATALGGQAVPCASPIRGRDGACAHVVPFPCESRKQNYSNTSSSTPPPSPCVPQN